jgi:4-hydroxy-3-methylbut-2-enyl diphosphate reductase
MRIILAQPRGFCAGVNMAIESLERAIHLFGIPIYVYHEIVHNKWVVERFERRGAVFVGQIDAVPEGATLLYSAHGVSPEIRRQAAQRRLRTIDATCPLVTKVHHEAIQFAREGYTIILIGHAGHDEVVGTMGEAAGRIQLVQSLEDANHIQVEDTDRIAYLTQTTLSMDDAEVIVDRLRQRFPTIVGPSKDDICFATQNRQEAVKVLSAPADLVLVVGSRNSSNSLRLAELARTCGVRAKLIDGPDDVDLAWFSDVDTVVITAGASAPEDVVQGCVELLCREFAAQVETQCVSTRHERVSFRLPPELKEP